MSDDIVERLHDVEIPWTMKPLCYEAADRIEALEAERDAESALADQLAEALAAILAVESLPRARAALAAWRTARKDQP